MSPLNEVWKSFEHCKMQAFRQERKKIRHIKTRCDLNRRQAETKQTLICFQYGEIQCTHILPPTQYRKMTVSLTFL